ncbi:MAG: hypothetical protein ABEJ36_04110 [Candidatus Nanosalina sp.]
MPTSPIGDELESDLRTTPEKYTEDLHKEMQSLHERIEEEMSIEEDAVKKDEEMIQQLENMMNMYARYENDLITFVTFLQDQPDDEDDMVMMSRFRDAMEEGKIELNNNPTELPQVIRSIEEDFKAVFDDLEEKDEELKEVIGQDYNMEEEIEIIEKMAKKLETITAGYEEARNNS